MFALSDPSWKALLDSEFSKPYYRHLETVLIEEYAQRTVYPDAASIFTAFASCPFEKVSVIILGQDPYHGEGQATGLAFGVAEGQRIPPSLQNIYKEIRSEFGTPVNHTSGDLSRLASQGVLLLNATLTVRAGSPGSHHGIGWETFTDAVIQKLSDSKEHLVFMLWGKHAQQKGVHIDHTKHLVLESPHPSPYSASSGFFGNGHFKSANEYLVAHGKKPIDWL